MPYPEKEQCSYYVYEHWRPDTGLPFYVGKGHRGRAGCLQRVNKKHSAVVNKLRRLGLNVVVRIVFAGVTEQMAFSLEKAQIAYWQRRGLSLANRTPGGEGSAGYVWTDEQRAQARARCSTPEVRKRLSEQAKTAMNCPDMRERHRLAVKAALNTSGVQQAMSVGWERWRIAGRKLSKRGLEHQAKITAASRVAMADPVIRNKHSLSLTKAWSNNYAERVASMRTPEARKRLSDSMILWWRRRKELTDAQRA